MDWEQWKTILWLRWRLTRNQWARQGTLNEVVGILLGALLIGGALLASVLGIFAGGWLAEVSPHMLLIVLDVLLGLFLFWWLLGLLVEIQRRESLDLSRLMHLPIDVRKIFVFNYLISWFTPSLIIAVPGLLCLTLGLSFHRSPWLLLLAPVILGLLFVVTAWTYLLRGWLASLMANERRRRTIVVVVTIFIVGCGQLPNLFLQLNHPASSSRRTSVPEVPAWLAPAQYALPPLWVGKSAEALAAGRPAFALVSTAVLALLGGCALYLGYGATVRAYLGSPRHSLRPRPAVAASPVPARRSRLLERKLPFMPEEAGVIALATIQSHLRAPEVKMGLFSQILMNVIFGVLIFRPQAAFRDFFLSSLFLGSLIAIFSMMGANQLFFNQFGYDRDGFRALVLSPVSRQNILLGKALGNFPFVVSIGFLLMVAALCFRLLPPGSFVASVITLVAAFFCYSSVGACLSIVAPFRMAQGSIKPTKTPPKVALIMLGGLIFTPLVAALIFLPAVFGWVAQTSRLADGQLVQLGASVLLLGLTLALFFGVLGPLGGLLARREKQVLLAVTRELE